jgi:5'-3' exonuclease
VKGVSELHEFDEAGVLDKYGVPADRYAEFAILRGDPSDGLPGVRGVGEKTARALVQAYPSLEALLKDAEAEKRTGAILQRSPGLRSAIREAADYIGAMQQVVPIRTAVEVIGWRRDPNDELLDELAGKWRLEGPVRRLRAALVATRAS